MALTSSTNRVVVFCKDTSLPDSCLLPERPSLLYVRGGERKEGEGQGEGGVRVWKEKREGGLLNKRERERGGQGKKREKE